MRILLKPYSKSAPPLLLGAFLLLYCLGCGDTFDINDLGETNLQGVFGDTTYVLQQPEWTGFNNPKDVFVGFEPFVFVADAGNDRIVMLDLAGSVAGYSQYIKNPTAITQDYKLNLLVCAEFDTTLSGQNITFGAIFRIDLYAAGHDLANAGIHRAYFDPLNPGRRYSGISILSGNKYYVARTGPDNSSIVDPDDGIMLFGTDDRPEPRVNWPGLSVDGTGLTTITRPTSVATFSKPTTDFLFTQQGDKSLFRTQWITQRTTGDITQWESYYSPVRDGDLDFLRTSLFDRPEDVTVDPSGNIYVIDAGLDSLFKFNSAGFLLQAFGGPEQFNHPEGVAIFDKTLYVADTGNNRILRFILSTDL